ncbi:response regulator [Candidatus Woesearchaeota archaeon]|nr:MAG: response regulator [Candidatus Woesearchaeota archaeon]
MPKKILVVDDDEAILSSLQLIFETSGNQWEIITASDGEQAIEAVKQELPDLVLLDLMMPNIDGFEVCKFIKKKFKIPVIILTARSDPGTKEMTKAYYRPDAYLTKPFDKDELLETVKKYLQ